ncbi:alpha/beta-hydrolase [Auriscalpium vulgare]|uniref:Alpha/beta-hydrolase n=1 Tax=Auriscalpium vulgare TaxID=40419 RepID=A0ACB8RBA9_9AGAM|nr:alpha/beta-hydrolase [Auriscalpium vulgare]
MQPSITVPYKQVDDQVSLLIDIYLPDALSEPVPAIVYFHGGGLTVGDRTSWFPTWIATRARASGIALVSADYSLLPPATGHTILADVVDLFAFLAAHGATHHVDAARLAAAGTSAGGLCAFLAAAHADPKPKAVLSLYGLGGDFLTPYFLTPKTQPFFIGREILPFAPFAAFLHPASAQLPALSGSPLTYHAPGSTTPGLPSNPRMPLARVYLQQGAYLDYYTGLHAPASLSDRLRALLPAGSESEVEVPAWPGKHAQLRAALPEDAVRLFPQLLVGQSGWPCTMLVHGAEDTAVRAQDARVLHALLEDAGVDARLRIVPGQEHSFDYQKGAEERFGELFDEAFAFVRAALIEA